MSVVKNYQDFKKNQPQYKSWKQERDLSLEKKVEYIKNNKINPNDYNNDIERAKIVLNAVDVMDEYSQSSAENMEQVTQAAIMPIGTALPYISLGVGGLVGLIGKKSRNAFNEIFNGNFKNIKHLIPSGLAAAATLVSGLSALTFWACKNQIRASRLARTEAMINDLSSINQFAVLDESQKAEVEKIADTIQVDKKESKQIIQKRTGLGILSSLKTLVKPDQKVVDKYNEISKQTDEEIKNIENIQLTKSQELEAKKDQELIQTIVEKVDIASQDYAENTELATGVLGVIIGGLGIGSFAGIKKLLSSIKPFKKYSNIAAIIISYTGMLAGAIYATKLQKQASRVGRYKARKELLDNPEQLIYIDKEKYKNSQIQPKEIKKDGYFKRLFNLIKDNKEYNEYIKNNNARNIQLRKAKDKIKLSDDQALRAEQLQKNVFKMFNRLDDKSQSYAEATEAIGDVAIQMLTLVSSLIPMVVLTAKTLKTKNVGYKDLALSFLPLIPTILLNIYITKEQKNASRVADMVAINELSDYRHFGSTRTIDSSKNESEKNIDINVSPMLKKVLGKSI